MCSDSGSVEYFLWDFAQTLPCSSFGFSPVPVAVESNLDPALCWHCISMSTYGFHSYSGGRDGVLLTNVTNQVPSSSLAGDRTPPRLRVSQTRTLCCLNSSNVSWLMIGLSTVFPVLLITVPRE